MPATTSASTRIRRLANAFDNTVIGNTANGNGTKGRGGGILLAGGPRGGVYGNKVENSTADGNGLGAVTLHSYAPGRDFNGNVITGNHLSNDGVNGFPTGAPGDSGAGIMGPWGSRSPAQSAR